MKLSQISKHFKNNKIIELFILLENYIKQKKFVNHILVESYLSFKTALVYILLIFKAIQSMTSNIIS